MLTGSNSVTVTELDDSVDCQYLKMRTLGIVGASIRQKGCSDLDAKGVMRRETAPGTGIKGNTIPENAKSGLSDHAHRLFANPRRGTEV
jgi:hypothetical protein